MTTQPLISDDQLPWNWKDTVEMVACTIPFRPSEYKHLGKPLLNRLIVDVSALRYGPARPPLRLRPPRPDEYVEMPSNYACFRDPEVARRVLESIRWPDRVLCPRCDADQATHLWPKKNSRRPVRPGVWTCLACHRQFTVMIRTPLERSHVPLHKWLLAIAVSHLNRELSASSLASAIGVSRETAYVLLARIGAACPRKMKRESKLKPKPTLRDDIAAVLGSASV